MHGMVNSYSEWKHCITVLCQIQLTPEFVKGRIAALSDKSSPGTARFIELYSDGYRLRVIQWFEQAQKELRG